jgi:soluble lytic murein transglycosylase-like protein
MTAYALSNPAMRLMLSARLDRFFQMAMKPFALLGALVAIVACTLYLQPGMTQKLESQALMWLLDRFESRHGMTPNPDAVERATAIDPADLPKQQAALAHWLSRKYRVAPEPVSALVAEAYELSHNAKLDPTLILSVMAIESSFNPFAQSPVGAQGLMQVMTKVHKDKFDSFGGNLATFDPVSNLRVGVKVLKDCVDRAGSVTGGLRLYLGAGPQTDDGGYVAKVLAEQQRLQQVAAGRSVPTFIAPSAVPAPAAAKPDSPATPPLADKVAVAQPTEN